MNDHTFPSSAAIEVLEASDVVGFHGFAFPKSPYPATQTPFGDTNIPAPAPAPAPSSLTVVGISGKAGVGKDYLSEHVFQPNGYIQFSLAWHFKVWLVGKGLATWEEVFITKPSHVRKLLQEEGTERGRDVYGEDIWCNTLFVWMRTLSFYTPIKKFVIPDVRFPNELRFIQENSGKVLRVLAPNRAENSSLSPEARLHISETALDSTPLSVYDGVIYNDYDNTTPLDQQVFTTLKGTL